MKDSKALQQKWQTMITLARLSAVPERNHRRLQRSAPRQPLLLLVAVVENGSALSTLDLTLCTVPWTNANFIKITNSLRNSGGRSKRHVCSASSDST